MKNTEFLRAKLIAARGIYNNKDVYENTLEAFKLAIDKDMAIHLSVQTTKDGVLVVYNDRDLTRLTSLKDQIETSSYEEINYLTSYHIPTFREVLTLIDGKVPIIINPRNGIKKYFLVKELVEYLDEYQGSFAVINESASIIKWFNKNRPNYIVGEVISKNHRFRRNLKDLIAHYSIVTDFKSVNLNRHSVRKINALKMTSTVLGYVIDSQEKYNEFKGVCDNLFIDNIAEIEL